MNTLVAAATASIGGGDVPLGEGGGTEKTRNFYRRIEKRPVGKLVFLLIRAASSISKTWVVFGKLKNVYTQINFHLLLNNHFLSTPPPQLHFFPNQPPGLPECIAWKQIWVLSKINYN